MRSQRFHGRIEDADVECAVPGCGEPGEFRAPLTPSSFDGPGSFTLLCLDHVRQHNSAYDYFAGMSDEEIMAEQSPVAGWRRATRAFSHFGANPGPAWADFDDPFDAIAARFRTGIVRKTAAATRFSGREQHALGVLGLDAETTLHAVRKRYSELVRRFHPDRNGGDRSHEVQLRAVIDAWQVLKVAPAFA